MRDVAWATDALPSRLPDAFLRPVSRTPGELLRIGAKQVTVVVADRGFSRRTQAYSGRTNPNYFIFMGYGDNGGRDAVSAIFRNGRYLFNTGFDVPFSIREARGGDGEKLRDGHTGLTFGGVVDKPAIRIAPVGSRPVMTVVGDTPELEFEISVLTPIRPEADLSEIEVGRDGLVVQDRYRRGLLLPQAASEHHWNRDTLLSHTCLKAGLRPDAFRSGAKISRFQAEVFSEESGASQRDRNLR